MVDSRYANELLLSYVYRDALGGEATQGSAYAGQNIYGWYTNWTNNYWSSFFNMISKNIDNLRKIKKETDDILYSMYSA